MNVIKRNKMRFWLLLAIFFVSSGAYILATHGSRADNRLVINEIMSANGVGLTDEDGEFSDWIEIYNRGALPINLSGWALTNDSDQPGKWPFPNITLGSKSYLLVFASGKDRRGELSGQALHTNFKLGKGGEFVALYNVLEDRLTDKISPGVQFRDISFGHLEDKPGYGYLRNPTPGRSNSALLALTENVAVLSPESAQPAENALAYAPAGSAASNNSPMPLQSLASDTPLSLIQFGNGALPTAARIGAQLLGYDFSGALPLEPYNPPSDLRITEIMYNPEGGNDYEFIELTNSGKQAITLGSATFEGIQYTFPYDAPLLGPSQFLVLVRNPQMFARRYPGVSISGIYEGNLSNQGEQLVLRSGAGEVWVSVAYDDENGWPLTPDGQGDSLRLVNEKGNPNNPHNWRASQTLHGSPGGEGPQMSVSVPSR